ncbi:nucleolar protein 8 [Tautogolabrus adspersus]
MRRLYVGGLSHKVTEKDLKDRFGKFGDVEDVELRTRRDEEGVPYKTFGYINIDISDADLKKCLTVLNKSKWKGGTLQIETAKESFLHRLAEERQAAEEQRLQPRESEDKRQKMLDSLSKAGVENFIMKAAVPGTEVPGHKDWVVSKFGRVLPVLQLQCKKGSKARTLKYDPSKYTHNIRKLDRNTEDQSTPVTQLTWELQGGDDDISKKRRGEFPPFEPSRPKKSRTDTVNSHNALGRSRLKQPVESVAHTEARQSTNNSVEATTNHRPPQRRGTHFPNGDIDSDDEIHRMVVAQDTSFGALQQEAEEDNLEVVGLDYFVKAGRSGEADDEDENDYDSADTDELLASRKPPPPPPQEKLTPPIENHLSGNDTDKKKKMKKKRKAVEEEEDSSDAEDQLTSRKPSSTQQSRDSGKKSSQSQSEKMTVLPVEPPQSHSDSDDEEDEDEEDEDEEELESASADDSSDSDYEAMFSNVTCLEISLADLQRVAEVFEQTSETTTPSILGSSSNPDQHAPKKGILPEDILASLMAEDSSEDEQKKKKKKKKRKAVMSTPLPAFQGTRVLNDGLETEDCQRRHQEEKAGGEVKKQKLDSVTEQRTAESSEEDEEEEEEEKKVKVIKNKAAVLKVVPTKDVINTEEAESDSSSSDDDEEEEDVEEDEEEEKKVEVVKKMAAPELLKVVPTKAAINKEEAETDSSSTSDDEEEEEKGRKATLITKAAVKASPSSSSSCSSSSEEDEDEIIPVKDALKAAPRSESSSSEEEEEEEKPAPPRPPLGAKEEEELQRVANMRRLAAVQQRQKEAEEHKKLIQGALANLDAPAAGAGKHIVFGSDDDEESEDDEKQQATPNITTPKKTLFNDSQSEDEDSDDEVATNENSTVKEKVHRKPSVPQLFGGSEDEEDGDEEEEGCRFDIRPQFEGRAGQKLMELQSRFGTDERFKMDSRFLEEEEDKKDESEKKKSVTEDEEALDEERKKNLSILQGVLGSSLQTCSSKTTVKAKTFRDVSALHYDPSREEHAAFETKTEETKESKSARRKKREEAQKLPEVSKDIYYDVSGDLKAVFGASKDEVPEEEEEDEEEKMNWDQEEEKEGEEGGDNEQPVPSLPSADLSTEKEASSGFKFSFFGDDLETESKETEEYKVESIQAPKVSWQQDPRFHDSSSEEEEEEQEEDEEQSSAVEQIIEEEAPSTTDRFFFFPEDSRLTEGPKLFCRPAHLEEQREQWEEQRTALRQEYRKKHKDARRKLKSSQKS